MKSHWSANHLWQNFTSVVKKNLENVNIHPYLGVEIDNRLLEVRNIYHICNTANRMLGLVRRNVWFCTESIKKTLYVTLVRPKLDYASIAWDPHFKCDFVRPEGVQRAAARFCTNDYDWSSSVTSMLEKLELCTLVERRKRSRLIFM